MSPAKPVPGAMPKAGFSKWISGHKWEAGLGAGGIAVTLFLAYRARQQAAANGGTGSSTSTGASQALPASYYPPTSGGGGGFAEELSPILSQLSQELAAANSASSSSSSSSSPTPANFSGLTIGNSPSGTPESGYGAPTGTAFGSPFVAPGGQSYAQIPNEQTLASLRSSGTAVFWEPSPGDFVNEQGASLTPYTPVFVQTPA